MDVLPDPDEDDGDASEHDSAGEHNSAHVAVQDNVADAFLKEHPLPIVVACMLVIILTYRWILKEEARQRRLASNR